MNEGPRGIVPCVTTRFLALLGTAAEVPPGCHGEVPAWLPQCINPAIEATVGEVAAKQRLNRIGCVAVLIAPFLLRGRARAD
jgi:hypothetical protein